MTTRLLFVCLGNICRSPTAEAIAKARAAGIGLEVESAGLAGWHVGEPPDPRSVKAGAARGYDLTPIRARRVRPSDFHLFDRIIAMDASNLEALRAMAPADSRAALALVRDFAGGATGLDVPDPYYDGNFDAVIDMLEEAIDGLLAEIAA
ncbi:MAG: low molecular weight protein-tyrosine-phosphatase [Rubricella sp.]